MNALHLSNLLLWLLLPASLSFALPRRLMELVSSPPLILTYHNGPILSSPTSIYLLWYGNFTASQRSIVTDFLTSLSDDLPQSSPSVVDWWSITTSYKDSLGARVSTSFRLTAQAFDADCSLGKDLKRSSFETLVNRAVYRHQTFPYNTRAIYFILTADDVLVERFCMNSCGFHDSTAPSPQTHNRRLIYTWVGNAGKQCPGQCAWPFAVPQYGPPGAPLVPPNADVGMDGMIINIATVLAGTATNPYDTGFYEGDATVPLEAATACTGIYGKGSYPGYPGDLLVDKKTGASYNTNGVKNREFLLPAMWDPKTLTCATSS